jgi:hypothetical protein
VSAARELTVDAAAAIEGGANGEGASPGEEAEAGEVIAIGVDDMAGGEYVPGANEKTGGGPEAIDFNAANPAPRDGGGEGDGAAVIAVDDARRCTCELEFASDGGRAEVRMKVTDWGGELSEEDGDHLFAGGWAYLAIGVESVVALELPDLVA